MNYKIYKEVILFHSILILFYRKLVLNDKTCLFESLGIMILIKNCTVLRKHVTLSINTCTYDLSFSKLNKIEKMQQHENCEIVTSSLSSQLSVWIRCIKSATKSMSLCKSRSMYCHYGYRFCIQRQNRTTVKQIVYLRGLVVVVIFRLL